MTLASGRVHVLTGVPSSPGASWRGALWQAGRRAIQEDPSRRSATSARRPVDLAVTGLPTSCGVAARIAGYEVLGLCGDRQAWGEAETGRADSEPCPPAQSVMRRAV